MSTPTSAPKPANPSPVPYKRPPRPIHKTLLHWTRALHTYLTMLSLILLIFFAFTGFILNNGGLYENSGKLFDLGKATYTNDRTAQLPKEICEGDNNVFAIEQYLRKHLGARGELPPDKIDGSQQTIDFPFKGPGRSVTYSVITTDGSVMIHEESNALAMMTDLHTGEHSGKVWPWFIDAVAAFLLFACLSGVILWITLPKRRKLGLLALAASILACAAVYYYLVP